jgi:hypothetical protein
VQLDPNPRRRLCVHEIMCGARVQQGYQAHTVDVHRKLQRAPGPWLNAGQCVERDRWLGGVSWRLQRLVLTDNLDDGHVFANFLVSMRECIITMETLPILPPYHNLRWGVLLDHRWLAIDGRL